MESAKDAPNRGSVFSFEEFHDVVVSEWSAECGTNLADWLSKKFMTLSLLLGALRTEQFDRFRHCGLKNVIFDLENRNGGRLCPMATASYLRVKPRSGRTPYNPDENFKLTIACLCKGDHEPLCIVMDQKGYPKEPITGNESCWFGLFYYHVQHLLDKGDLDSKLLQTYNYRKKKFGTTNVGTGAAKRALREFCELVGVVKKGLNNISIISK